MNDIAKYIDRAVIFGKRNWQPFAVGVAIGAAIGFLAGLGIE